MLDNHYVLNAEKLQKTFPDRKIKPSALYYSSPTVANSSSTSADDAGQSRVVGLGDNHKPKIIGCDKLAAASVREEQPTGTFVVQVHAEDVNVNDQIEFSLVNSGAAPERNQLRIDRRSGRIYTNHVFDRDEPIREKQVYVTVRATDNGRPPLDDVCTFRVQIEDVNDNAPMFDKTRYDELISRDTRVNATVMRISASDFDDGDNSVVHYAILEGKEAEYFAIDPENGLIQLRRSIRKPSGQFYAIKVRAFNVAPAVPQQESTMVVRFKVMDSDRKSPRFVTMPQEPVQIYENFSNFSKELLKIKADSNVANSSELIFELLTGRTEQTNSKNTFVFTQEADEAVIRLGSALDYESITDYCLTVRVKNVHDMSAELLVRFHVLDVNDNIPYFVEVTSGTILENEEPRTGVMKVRALDMDGTIANNIVKYKLADHKDCFDIDPFTGQIESLVEFDREAKDFYNVKVIAYDNSPSSLYEPNPENRPNLAYQVFRIEIGDKNDYPPVFVQQHYYVEQLPEDTNKNHLVLEVVATDVDTASVIQYRIIDGNIQNAFKIDPMTGKITVNEFLDYEKIRGYNLKVRAFDGLYETFTSVKIELENMNDNPPKFCDKFAVTVNEGQTYDSDEECILKIVAYDPDINDRKVPQNIRFSIVKADQRRIFAIDKQNCLRIKVPLDRDPPNGFREWHVLVAAVDEMGEGLKAVTEVVVHLADVNDNAPFLTNQMPVVWMENQGAGDIVQLEADDYDEPKNGPPFHYQLDPRSELRHKFEVTNDGMLRALVLFDREEVKEYFVPIVVTDSGYPNRMQNTSLLHIIIGDENDNPMVSGASEIFVTKLDTDQRYEIEIGRVFVDDPDDWDLGDKHFYWKNNEEVDEFKLNSQTGTIYMSSEVKWPNLKLEFEVLEESKYFPKHSVEAVVWVNVKQLPEEAVLKSGSLRLVGISAEEFVVVRHGQRSLMDRLQEVIANLFAVDLTNVDIVTVRDKAPNFLDVRYAVHGSPYYHRERLNTVLDMNRDAVEQQLNVTVFMAGINECNVIGGLVTEREDECGGNCDNRLRVLAGQPITVATNRTSFVSVNAFDEAECSNQCSMETDFPTEPSCLNGGTLTEDYKCECMDTFEGARCELTSATFTGNKYALFGALQSCDLSSIAFSVKASTENGLIFYSGPNAYNSHLRIDKEYIAFELVDRVPQLTVQFVDGAVRLQDRGPITLNEFHQFRLKFEENRVEMIVDNCYMSNCVSLGESDGLSKTLKRRNALQFGGAINQRDFPHLSRNYQWQYTPTGQGFVGCLTNVSVNDDRLLVDFNGPVLANDYLKTCSPVMLTAVTLQLNSTFYAALCACLLLVLVLIIALLVLKKKKWSPHDRQNILLPDKDFDEIRDSIIHYECEGGGEEDINHFSRNMLYHLQQANQLFSDVDPNKQVAEMGNFLAEQKFLADRDTFDGHHSRWDQDNVRLYAYEGCGASSCESLSSLGLSTGTNDDDQDLNFEHLGYLGPRFRKLALLYEQPADEEEAALDDDDDDPNDNDYDNADLRGMRRYYECTDV